MKFALTLFLLAAVGCQKSAPADILSPDFRKAGKFAYVLLQQADEGLPVSGADISHALADVQAAAMNSDEQMAALLLARYRTNVDYTRMKISQAELASTMASMKQIRCEIDKMFNEGAHGVEAMQACGEKVG